jgi:hypothetical protein
LAQEIEQKSQTQTQTQKITLWDGSTWSNGSPTLQTKAVFASNFTTTQDISALEMEILPEVKVTVTDNTILKVVNTLKVAPTAQLILEETAQLLNRSPNVVITVKRKTRPVDKFDYTYFCSPVTGQVLNQITDYSVGNINNFYTNVDGLYEPTLSDKYFYFDAFATPDAYLANVINSGRWLNALETSSMELGKGYIVRGPQSFAQNNKQVWWTQFTGEAHTGTYTIPISGQAYTPCVSTKSNPNFIGNPYPSMLDADTFLSNPTNAANLAGSIAMWTHNSPPVNLSGETNPFNYDYTADDYVLYNLVGGIGTGRVNGNPIYAPNNSNRPTGKIGVCQGFFVNGEGATIVFNDDMRDDSQNANTDNQQFYRDSNNTSIITPIAKNRFWVSLEGAAGAGAPYKEVLIGYMPQVSVTAMPNTAAYTIPGSENTFDKMYDAELNTISTDFNFYTILDQNNTCPKLSIQGRKLDANFNTNDVIPLGFTCPAGDYNIKLELVEGLFSNQGILLRESVSNDGLAPYVYYDINTPHTFTTTSQTDNTTRFAIVFGKIVNLKLNIEGYYRTTTHAMDSVRLNQFTSTDATEVGFIDVELHEELTFGLAETANNVMLYTDGTATAYFNTSQNGNYYLAIRHRNAIETWSATVVNVGAVETNYDFTDAASKAYGVNQVEVEPGVFAFYTGDINQDGNIDNSDQSLWETDSNNYSSGDFVSDLNGDGNVDNADYNFLDANSNNFIFTIHP